MEERIKKNHDNMNYMESIIVMYHKAEFVLENSSKIKKTTLVNETGDTYYLSEDSLHGYINFKNHVDHIVNMLDPYEKEFLVNEFFRNNCNWWVNMYSKSTYYRFKNHTVDKFLKLYHL